MDQHGLIAERRRQARVSKLARRRAKTAVVRLQTFWRQALARQRCNEARGRLRVAIFCQVCSRTRTARMGLLMVVNVLNELLLKPAWEGVPVER